jgi:FHA domain
VSYTCPDGHRSESGDYCDVCGTPITALPASAAATSPPSAAAPSPVTAPPGQPATATAASVLDLDAAAPAAVPERSCPHCGGANAPDALFCEDCGYDFTTGQLPRETPSPAAGMAGAAGPAASPPTPPAPTASPPVEWVAEVWVDPDWYAAQETEDPCPSAGMPVVVPLTGTSLLVGRRSVSRSIRPQVDCSSDTGVSHRHAQLTTDGQRWWVEDLQSSNGTYIGSAGAGLPNAPIEPGQRVELADDDRIYLGAWTRLVVRRATPDERAGSA